MSGSDPTHDRDHNQWQPSFDPKGSWEIQPAYASELRIILDTVPEGILTLDSEGKILIVNQQAKIILGYPGNEMVGLNFENLIPEEYRHLSGSDGWSHLGMDGFEAGVAQPVGESDGAATTGAERTDSFLAPPSVLSAPPAGRVFPDDLLENKVEVMGRRKDGGLVPLELQLRETVVGGRTLYAASIRDISERRQAEIQRQEKQERYALALKGANDGLWDWNIVTNAVHFSQRWKAMLGFQDHEVGNKPDEWFSRIHPEDTYWVRTRLDAVLKGLASQFENEYRMLHKDGRYRWMLTRGIAVKDESGRVYRMAGSQTDITDRRVHDPLTNLPNRTLFVDRLERLVARANRRSDYSCAVLFLDLDRFKMVNDTLGHLVGDEVLIGLSRRIEACLRPRDTLARLGGDEFAILLDDIRDVSDAVRVAQRINRKLVQPFKIGQYEVLTSVSIGIALSDTGYERASDFIRDADAAMFRSKAGGGARHEVFDTRMRARASARIQLENELRQAVDQTELCLHFQPIVSLRTGRLAGFESLLRWNHPERGLLYPADFIQIAEDIGVVHAMSAWALRKACECLQLWREIPDGGDPLFVSVNLTGRKLSHGEIIEQIDRVLWETKVDPERLRIDLSETTLMENADSAGLLVSRLDERHVGVNLDDFGAGYVSIAQLHRLPLHSVKIDRSLVSKIQTDRAPTEIVRTILTLAGSIGVEAVAVGVETPFQADCLREWGCGYAQGNYFSLPLEVDATSRIIETHPVWTFGKKRSPRARTARRSRSTH